MKSEIKDINKSDGFFQEAVLLNEDVNNNFDKTRYGVETLHEALEQDCLYIMKLVG
jgi:hypothetical protein